MKDKEKAARAEEWFVRLMNQGTQEFRVSLSYDDLPQKKDVKPTFAAEKRKEREYGRPA